MRQANDNEGGPHLVDTHVGMRVRALRMDRKMTQQELAKALGLTFQQVQKYEKGSNRISASKLWLIANYFKAPVAAFFDGLTEGRPGMAESDAIFDHDAPPTPTTSEITRTAPRLSPKQQKVVLAVMKEFMAREDER